MAHQTAVKWYYEQTVVLGKTNYAELLEQANKMFEEQIINAHKEGNKYNGWALQHEHEQYYKETYGKDSND